MNSFKNLGWSDPFPDDDKTLDGSVDDELYKIALSA